MAKILIVDDSKFMRAMLSDILSEEGMTVEGEAENGREAVELFDLLMPDVVTLDIIMPEVEGMDALSALKTMVKKNPDVPVLIVSALGQEEVVEEFMHAGAAGFILKPFKREQVGSELKKIACG